MIKRMDPKKDPKKIAKKLPESYSSSLESDEPELELEEDPELDFLLDEDDVFFFFLARLIGFITLRPSEEPLTMLCSKTA